MKNILIIEPICRNFEHAKFNSALLTTILSAFPKIKIEFLSEISHQNNIIDLLKYANIPNLGITFRELRINWSKFAWTRYFQEKYFCKTVFKDSNTYDIILFCSSTSSLIIAIKEYLEHFSYKPKVIAIPHAVLAGVATRSKRIWNWPLDIKNALRKKTPRNLHFIALSQTIYESIAEQFEITNWHFMDHPYIFDFQPTTRPPQKGDTINFGILGAIRESFNEYYKIAAEIKQRFSNSKFYLVGHLANKKYKIEKKDAVINEFSKKPISYSEYNEHMQKINYILWIQNPNKYKYVVSNTILDAFNYGKPGVYLVNPLIFEYKRSMGDFGYLCNSINEIKLTLINILKSFPEDRYLKQIENIVKNRNKFSPATLAYRFKEIVKKIYEIS